MTVRVSSLEVMIQGQFRGTCLHSFCGILSNMELSNFCGIYLLSVDSRKICTSLMMASKLLGANSSTNVARRRKYKLKITSCLIKLKLQNLNGYQCFSQVKNKVDRHDYVLKNVQ